MSAQAREATYAAAEQKRPPFLIDLLTRLVKTKPLATFGGVIFLVLLFTGLAANLLAPYGYNEFILANRLALPSVAHPLGTDNLGRDLLSRIIFGARISMIVGLGGAILDVAIASFLGITSGYLGGKFDIILQRFVDAWMCIPPLLLFLTVMSVVGPGLVQVTLVLGISSGIRSSRTVRSAVIAIKGNVYLEAARAIGAPTRRILTRHVLPNVTAPLLIIFSLAIGGMISQESMLSFLGFGIPPPMPSWGGMLSGAGRQYMLLAPWMALWPGVALGIVIYGVNMLGDGIRDLLDPRLRGGLGRYEKVKRKIPGAAKAS